MPISGGVSHREARSGCDISLEANIWIQGEEKGGGESRPPLPRFLPLSVFREACWYLGSATRWGVSDFDVACVNILMGAAEIECEFGETSYDRFCLKMFQQITL